MIIVLSGPSGAGKDSVRDLVLEWAPAIHRVVTATTRPPRPGETDGHDYHFLTEAEFGRRLAEGGFVEHAFVYDHLNGVPRDEIEAPLAAGKDVLARVDVQGAATIKRLFPDAVLIFVAPPSVEETARRMRARDADSDEAQKRRLETAAREMEAAAGFDHVVVNETGRLEETARRVLEIVAAEKRKRGGRPGA